MSRYVKFLSALLGGIATWGFTAASDDAISAVEWFGLLGVMGTALAVFQFPNTPPAGELRDPDMSETDLGHVDSGGLVLGLAVGLLLAVLVLLLRR